MYSVRTHTHTLSLAMSSSSKDPAEWQRTELPPLPETVHGLCQLASDITDQVSTNNSFTSSVDNFFEGLNSAMRIRVDEATPNAPLSDYTELVWSILEALHAILMHCIVECPQGRLVPTLIENFIGGHGRDVSIGIEKYHQHIDEAIYALDNSHCCYMGYPTRDGPMGHPLATFFILFRPLHRDPAKAMALVKAWIGSPLIEEYKGRFVFFNRISPWQQRRVGTELADNAFRRATLLHTVLTKYTYDTTADVLDPVGYQFAAENHRYEALSWVLGPESNLFLQYVEVLKHPWQSSDVNAVKYYEHAGGFNSEYIMLWYRAITGMRSLDRDAVIKACIGNYFRLHIYRPTYQKPTNFELIYLMKAVQTMAIEDPHLSTVLSREDVGEIATLGVHAAEAKLVELRSHVKPLEPLLEWLNEYCTKLWTVEFVARCFTSTLISMMTLPPYVKPDEKPDAKPVISALETETPGGHELIPAHVITHIPGVSQEPVAVAVANLPDADISHKFRMHELELLFAMPINRAFFMDTFFMRIFECDIEEIKDMKGNHNLKGFRLTKTTKERFDALYSGITHQIVEQARLGSSRKLYTLSPKWPGTGYHFYCTLSLQECMSPRMETTRIKTINSVLQGVQREVRTDHSVHYAASYSTIRPPTKEVTDHIKTLMMVQQNLDGKPDEPPEGRVYDEILSLISEMIVGPGDVKVREDGTEYSDARRLNQFVSKAVRREIETTRVEMGLTEGMNQSASVAKRSAEEAGLPGGDARNVRQALRDEHKNDAMDEREDDVL